MRSAMIDPMKKNPQSRLPLNNYNQFQEHDPQSALRTRKLNKRFGKQKWAAGQCVLVYVSHWMTELEIVWRLSDWQKPLMQTLLSANYFVILCRLYICLFACGSRSFSKDHHHTNTNRTLNRHARTISWCRDWDFVTSANLEANVAAVGIADRLRTYFALFFRCGCSKRAVVVWINTTYITPHDGMTQVNFCNCLVAKFWARSSVCGYINANLYMVSSIWEQKKI